MADPIHQFEIKKIATLGHIGGHEIAFTNSALFMVITVVGIWALLVGGSSARALVPGRHAVGRRAVLRIRRQHACKAPPARRA